MSDRCWSSKCSKFVKKGSTYCPGCQLLLEKRIEHMAGLSCCYSGPTEPKMWTGILRGIYQEVR